MSKIFRPDFRSCFRPGTDGDGALRCPGQLRDSGWINGRCGEIRVAFSCPSSIVQPTFAWASVFFQRSGHRLFDRGAGRSHRRVVHSPHTGRGADGRSALRPGRRHGGCSVWRRRRIRFDHDFVFRGRVSPQHLRLVNRISGVVLARFGLLALLGLKE